MIATKTSRSIEDLDPAFQPLVRDLLERSRHLGAFITDGARTFEEQQRLYDQGRTHPGEIVTKALPGWSYHNYGLAVDIAFIVKGKLSYDAAKYRELISIANQVGVESLFQRAGFDKPHFQYPDLTIQLIRKHQGLSPGRETATVIEKIVARQKEKFKAVQDGVVAGVFEAGTGKCYLVKNNKAVEYPALEVLVALFLPSFPKSELDKIK